MVAISQPERDQTIQQLRRFLAAIHMRLRIDCRERRIPRRHRLKVA
jgi:hypothetical protein